MGNNICSICSNQTTITEINQLSLTHKKYSKNKLNNRSIKLLKSSIISNKNESLTSLNDLSIDQEINYAKQSQYDFNNLIYLVNKESKNIIENHIKNKTQIKDDIKNLFFIDTYENYKKYKNDGIYTVTGANLKEIEVPKDIYEDKGINYIKKENYLEVLFIQDMKMIRININDLKSDNLNKIKRRNNDSNIINYINNLNNIESFSKENRINRTKDYDIKDNVFSNYSSIYKKDNNDRLNITSIQKNKNSELFDNYSFYNYIDNSLEIQSNLVSTIPELIFKTQILMAIEENKIINCLKSKGEIKNKNEYYLVNSTWLEEYKKIFNYSEIYKLCFDKEKNKDNINLKNSEIQINNLIKNNPKILESIKYNYNKIKLSSTINDVKKLRHFIHHYKYENDEELNKTSIPYHFDLINKITLDLIIKQFNFKCINKTEGRKTNCSCEFCGSNFLKQYICYIGNEFVFISYKDNNNNYYYYQWNINIKNIDKINNMSIDILFIVKNNEIFINEIINYFFKGNKIKDFSKIQNLDKNKIIQVFYDMNNKNIIGKIVNIKLLIKQKGELINKKKSRVDIKFIESRNTSNRDSIIKKLNTVKKSFKEQPLLLYKKPSLIGLNRSGQPFFFNPILQCLSNIPELTNYFLSNISNFNDENNKKILPFSHEYAKLIWDLWKVPTEEDSEVNNYPYYEKSASPFQLKQLIANNNNEVLMPQKNMFRELFLFILKSLDNELNTFELKNRNSSSFLLRSQKLEKNNDEKSDNDNDSDSDRKSSNTGNSISSSSSSSDTISSDNEEKLLKKFRDDYHSKFNSIIQKNFYSEIQVCFQCLTCNLYKFHYEIINSYTFDLEIIKKNIMSKYKLRDIMKKIIVLSVPDCFENEEKPSSFDLNYLCEKCQLKTFERQIRIIKAPNILVLFFKEKEILQVEFDISLDLQLNAFIHDKIYENENEKDENDLEFNRNSYDLIGVLCSPYESTKKGTYISYCRNPVNNLWYCYNDSIVTNVDNQFLKNIKIPKLLIYRKKENIYLIFIINEVQKLNLMVHLDMSFQKVISFLYAKYSWLEVLNLRKFSCNEIEIDINKTVYQNNLNNGSVIICSEK